MAYTYTYTERMAADTGSVAQVWLMAVNPLAFGFFQRERGSVEVGGGGGWEGAGEKERERQRVRKRECE